MECVYYGYSLQVIRKRNEEKIKNILNPKPQPPKVLGELKGNIN